MTAPETLDAADLQILDTLRANPARTAVLTDFDGTLSMIVERPSDARPLPGVPEVLARLAERYARVGVVSGRNASFLLDHIGSACAQGLVLSGSYGLERVEGGDVQVHPAAGEWLDVVEQAAAKAEQLAPPGVIVERKHVSMTVHVRTAPEHAEWAHQWAVAESHVTGLALHDARMSWELRPPIKIDKGSIVAELIEGAEAACFLGDDVGDMPAFDALDQAEANGASVVRIAVRSDEAPADLIARADLVVDGPPGSLEVLRYLAG